MVEGVGWKRGEGVGECRREIKDREGDTVGERGRYCGGEREILRGRD